MDRNRQEVFMTGHAIFAKPAVMSATTAGQIVTDVALSSLTAGAFTILAQPDYPRTIRAYFTDGGSTILTGTVTVVGVDQNGDGIQDVIAITPVTGGRNGVKAFSWVTSITWNLLTGTVTTTSDTMAIGWGPALGLPGAPGCTYIRLLKGIFDGGHEAGTFNATYGTYTPVGTMNAAKAVEVTYLYKYSLVV